MAMIPLSFRNWWDDALDLPLRQTRVPEQHFGTGVHMDDLMSALSTAASMQAALQPMHRRTGSHYTRPWRHALQQNRWDHGSMVCTDKDRFQINLDVQHFTPEEISVTANEKTIMIEGRHEEKEDEHGVISRHFVRRYVLPEGHDPKKIESKLSSDGILSVTAPKEVYPEHEAVRSIPVVATGKPMQRLGETQERPALMKK